MISKSSSDSIPVKLAVDGDHLVISGSFVRRNPRAGIFFQGVLGGTSEEDGWRCPRRRLSIDELVLRVNGWLVRNGYEVVREGIADDAIRRDLERQRAYERTRTAASDFRRDPTTFDYRAVETALKDYGWSDARALKDHQRLGVGHALTAINAANFSVPGSGKTATTLAIGVTHLVSGTIDIIVVIGPLSSFEPWESEAIAAVGDRIPTKRVRGPAPSRLDLYDSVVAGDLLLMSYATAAVDHMALSRLFEDWNVMLVIDESHRIKRFRGGTWAPAMVRIARKARVRLILSGTPMPQSGLDLYTQLNVLWPDNQLTGSRAGFSSGVNSNFRSVMRKIEPFLSRTPKSALGLRDYRVHEHNVPLTGLQAEIYRLIEDRFRLRLSDYQSWSSKIDALRRGRPIRLLQAAANPELLNRADHSLGIARLPSRPLTLMDRLARYGANEIPAKSILGLRLVEEIAQRGGKVVCWSNFVGNLDAFRRLLEKETLLPVYQIDGRVPAGSDGLHAAPRDLQGWGDTTETREEIIATFLDTKGPAVLVTNPASCSESISLHRACHNAIYLDRTYDAALWLQSIDRIHRLGLSKDASVEIHVLTATLDGGTTIDSLVANSLHQKEKRMRELLEGADIAPLELSEFALDDAEGDHNDLEALLRYLIGESK